MWLVADGGLAEFMIFGHLCDAQRRWQFGSATVALGVMVKAPLEARKERVLRRHQVRDDVQGGDFCPSG